MLHKTINVYQYENIQFSPLKIMTRLRIETKNPYSSFFLGLPTLYNITLCNILVIWTEQANQTKYSNRSHSTVPG